MTGLRSMAALNFTLDILRRCGIIMLQCSNNCNIDRRSKIMKTKSTHKSVPVAEKNEALENFVPLYLKGIEVIAELQKKSLEIAAQQNAEWAGASKKAWSRFVPASQVNPVFDLAAQAFDTILEGQ